MKKILITFILLMSSVFTTAQTRNYSADVLVTNLSYGMVAQVWNPTGNTIYLDGALATDYATVVYTPSQGTPMFGFGFSNVEESQCQLIPTVGLNTLSASSARVSSQPCTPNGLPYGQQPNGTFNYTPTNNPTPDKPNTNLAHCYGDVCSVSFTTPIPIPPNHGITLYFAFVTGIFPNLSWHPWQGQQAVTFFLHE